MNTRTVRRQYRAIRDDIGDLQTWRPLPNREIEQIDPFLFLNHHGPQVYPPGNRGLPFGPHPHRGFETVTFIVDGSLMHRDSHGHESVIRAGGIQWMTAGRGLEHAEISPEEFRRDGGPMEILQLWVNLPSELKMTDPKYVGLQETEIPAYTKNGATAHLIAGSWDGHAGRVASLTGITLMTIDLERGASLTLPAPRERNVFLYIVRGELKVSGTIASAFRLVDVDSDADSIELEATANSLLIFAHAAPIGEPVVAHGPFVMNSVQEITDAIRDYQDGKFGKV